MNDRGVEQRKRVRAAPPARCVGRITAVAGPGVSLIVFQHVVLADVLREAVCLENAHVLAGREDVRAVQRVVDADDKAGGELALLELAGRQLGRQRSDEVAPDHRGIGDARVTAGRDLGQVYNVKVTLDLTLAFLFCGLRIIEYMERIVVGVLGIDAVAGKAAAQAVGTIVHGADRVDNAGAVLTGAVLVEDTGDRAACGDADLPFFL